MVSRAVCRYKNSYRQNVFWVMYQNLRTRTIWRHNLAFRAFHAPFPLSGFASANSRYHVRKDRNYSAIQAFGLVLVSIGRLFK